MDLLINFILITALSTVGAMLSQPDALPIVELFSSLILAALPQLLRTAKNALWHRFANGCAALFILLLVLLSWSRPAFLYFIPLLIGSIDRIPYLYALLAVPLSWIQHPPPHPCGRPPRPDLRTCLHTRLSHTPRTRLYPKAL